MKPVYMSIPLMALTFLALSGCGGEVKVGENKPKPAEVTTAETAKKEVPAEKKEVPAEKKEVPAEKKAEAPPAETKGEAPAPTTAKPAAGGTKQTNLGDSGASISFPATWKEVPPSNRMRLAEFVIPKNPNDPEDAELSIFKMGGGGGADANIARWVNQFGGQEALKSKRTIKTASGVEAIVADLEGEYTAMTMQGTSAPKKGYRMLGAVIMSDKGEFYVKFTGPQATIAQNKEGFEKMIESFK
ncbi:MAG TPA: hypothetical protein VEK08_09730 [Planctomycetota bacterium]|nr:hypothetical protein [Planctomycetota bacterium]